MDNNKIEVGLALREMSKYLKVSELKIFDIFNLELIKKAEKKGEEKVETANQSETLRTPENSV